MSRREYGQACSIASALDRIGERWSLLIVRELLLGPLRFSDLTRAVGGAPTDVLTKRLRDLERDGVVTRRELGPPASGVVYELTDLGRELEPLLLELGRWGLHFYDAGSVAGIEPSWLPNSLRVILRPPADAELTVQVRCEGSSFLFSVAGGRTSVARGEAPEPDLTISGPPGEIVTALVVGDGHVPEVGVEGDREAFEALREMVEIPERLREEAEAAVLGPATARTA